MAEPDIYGDLCADLPPTPAVASAPAPALASVPPSAAPAPRSEAPAQRKAFRARNLVWKPPTDAATKAQKGQSLVLAAPVVPSGASGTSGTNGPCDTNSTSQKVEVIDLESLEELQVLNTSSFTAPAPSAVPSAGSTPTAKSQEKPTAESPAATSGGGSQSAPTTGGSTDGSADKDAASSSLPGQDYSEFIPVDRCRGRNLGKIPVETETEATQVASKDPDELQVLNASAASMPDGLDIYGDLCSDLPRTSAQGLAAGSPGKPFRRPRARNLVWKAENPSRPPRDPESEGSEG